MGLCPNFSFVYFVIYTQAETVQCGQGGFSILERTLLQAPIARTLSASTFLIPHASASRGSSARSPGLSSLSHSAFAFTCPQTTRIPKCRQTVLKPCRAYHELHH